MNAEKAKPTVEIELGGKKRFLRYDMNAACLIEETLGKRFVEIDFNAPAFRDVRAFLFALLKKSEPNLTLEKVGALMEGHKIMDLWIPCVDAFTRGADFGQKKEGEEEEKNAEQSPS